MNIFLIGDIVGRTGRKAVRALLPSIKNKYQIDFIIANGENAAGGFGLTRKVADELFDYGINCLTMGNHTWDNKDIFNFIGQDARIIRPLNYSPAAPGRGWATYQINQYRITVINLIGQTFMNGYNNPFSVFDQHIAMIKKDSDFIVVDFHAEATSEKLAFAHYVDGQVACIVGTHTHVQTADQQILPRGSGYITDLGLTGAVDSILGMSKQAVIERFITGIPHRYDVANGQYQLAGLVVKINEKTGLTNKIYRILEND
ncbi:MAG: TIGR00282 family metallophosphoesterase [Halanaerobiales bacterium]|nr:TIGR00282 family metallophosphoesterase [Halanaerobiales bacterium]